MYGAIVRARFRDIYRRTSKGDWLAGATGTAADVHHVFPGEHALGGERHTREAFVRWLERVHSLFPDLKFEVTHVASSGWPWDTWAAAEWKDHALLPTGEKYENAGVMWINVRWGKVTEIHEYTDSERVAEACRSLHAAGVEEAGAEPIGDMSRVAQTGVRRRRFPGRLPTR